MADTREIVVTIKSQAAQTDSVAGSPGRPADADPKTSAGGSGNVSTKANDSQQAMTTVMVQLGEKALRQAVEFTLSTADYFIQRGFYLKDDYIGQRNYQIAKNVISGVASDAMNIASWGAKWGIAGLTIGAVLTAVSRVGEYHKALNMQDLTIRQMDATLDFSRQRAGYSLTSGSVGENL